MKKKLFAVVVAALFVSACGGSSSGGGGDVDTDVCGGAGLGCITGSVVDATGTAIASPTVTWVGASNLNASVNASVGTKAFTGTDIATGNEQGWFTADDITAGDQVICYSAAGYVPVCRSTTLVEAKTTPIPDVVLPVRGTAITVNTVQTAGASATDAVTGAAVIFNQNNSVCDASGAVVTGSVECYLTPLDPQSALDQTPDTFQAVSATNVRGTMVSSAIMSLECEQGGAPLQICTGSQALIRIPIYTSCSDTSINPITDVQGWRYDETTGLWSEYNFGDCTKVGCTGQPNDYYSCTIDHMTWVNGDKWIDDVCLTGQVLGSPSGTGEGRVWVECSGGGWRNTAYTNESGVFCIPAPTGRSYSCRVCDNVRCNDVADNITGTASGTLVEFPLASCPDANCTDIGDFIFARPRVSTTLTWGALPSDLDSHFGTSDAGTNIYFANKDADDNAVLNLTKGSLTSAPYIALDTDDVTSYGPEVTSVMSQVANGTYRFCVRNFTGESGGGLCDSSAKVRVEIPSQGGDSVNVAQTREVPTSCPSGSYLLWQVYQIVVSDGIVTGYETLDTIVESSSASTAITDCFQ